VKDAVERRCGPLHALKEQIEANLGKANGDRSAVVKAVIETCKVTGVPAGDVSKFDPWGLLASAVVSDLLAEDPQSSADERKMANALMHLCSIPIRK
jgi:hypothetical protein